MSRLNRHSASAAARVVSPYVSRHTARRSSGRFSRRGSSPTTTAFPLRSTASQSRSAKCPPLVINVSPLPSYLWSAYEQAGAVLGCEPLPWISAFAHRTPYGHISSAQLLAPLLLMP